MKFWLITIVCCALVALTAVFTLRKLAESHEVVSHYQTRQKAEADGLFERGWLPSIIPVSSYGIVTKNDLDTNVSHGEFHFRREELEAFISQLKRFPSVDSDEFVVYRYEQWTFLISSSGDDVFCKYQMHSAGLKSP